MKTAKDRKARQSGFYWVKYPHGVWMIAMHTKGVGWAAFHGDPEEFPLKDDQFAEIDERPIVREEPVAAKISGTTERIPQNE
jgi:hypothetical protein